MPEERKFAIGRDAARQLSGAGELQHENAPISPEMQSELIKAISVKGSIAENRSGQSARERARKSKLFGEFSSSDYESNRERVAQLLEATRAFDAKYESTGGPFGPLGMSVSDVTEQDDGTFREDFRGGHLRSGSGGVDVEGFIQRGVIVRYRGLQCFGKQAGSGSDEPYVLVSVYQPEPWAKVGRGNAEVLRFPASGTYENVESGNSRTGGPQDVLVIAPQDIVVSVVVMEHDDGDPEKVRTAVKDAIQKAADSAAAAASGGAATSVPMDSNTLQGMAVDWLTGVAVSVLGSGDDVIGTASFVIKQDQLTQLPPMQTLGDIQYNFAASKDPISDGDASYGVYFEVFAVEHTEWKQV